MCVGEGRSFRSLRSRHAFTSLASATSFAACPPYASPSGQNKFRAASYGKGKMNVKGLFARYDKDGSGELDYHEVTQVCKKTIPGITEQEITQIFYHIAQGP